MSTAFVARIMQDDKTPIGVGFYIGGGQIVTCAHVIDAIKKKGGGSDAIFFDFPLVQDNFLYTGQILKINSDNDIALVETQQEISAEIEVARLAIKSTDLWGHHFRVFGFPAGYNDGVWASGVITGKQASGWIQIESVRETGYQIQPGFSGSPVWDENYQAVVGMIVASDTSTITKTAFMVPIDLIIKCLPDVFAQGNIGVFHEDWGDVITEREFLGRENELFTLKEWAKEKSCKIVSLIGMGGIGKTALALIFCKSIRNNFDYIFWRDLRNGPSASGVIGYCIKFISNQTVVELPDEIDERVGLLADLAKKSRCLVVLDNYETVLQGNNNPGKHKKEFEGYSQLLKRLSQSDHNSLLVITSREKPKELTVMGETCHTLNLSGLEEKDALGLLQSRKLNASNENWSELNKKYAGNPLALMQVASTIEELFDGDVEKFLQESVGVFGDIKDLLDEQMDRLPKLGQDIMYWLAIEREAVTIPDLASEILFWLVVEKEKVTIEELQSNIRKPVSRRDLLETLEMLFRQSMIEKSGSRFGLQPVVMEYLTEQLIEKSYDDIMEASVNTIGNYSLIKALSKDHVRESQVIQIVDPLLQKLQISLGKEQISNKLLDMVKQFKSQKIRMPGYFGGNLLNILNRLGYDFSGQDFSGLIIWQAYLDGITLRNVDFSESEFDKTVFTDTLGTILCVAFSPDFKYFAAGLANGEIRVWDASDYKQIKILRGHTDWVRSIVFSPNSETLISCSEDYTLRLWNLEADTSFSLEGHTNRVWNLSYSANGNMIVSCSEDKNIILWDAKTGSVIKLLSGHEEPVWCCAFSPDSQFLASSSDDKTIKIWDIGAGKCVKTIHGHTAFARSVVFSSDGEKVISGSDDKTVRIWSVATGQCLSILEGHTDRVKVVRVSPDGNLIASVGEDRTIRFWDINWSVCVKVLQGHRQRVRDISFSPDSSLLLSGSDDQTIRVWDVKNGQCVKVIHGYANPILALDVSGDGRVVVTGTEDHAVRIWDSLQGKCTATLFGHTKQVWAVALNTHENKIASGSGDETIRIWDLDKRKCISILSGHLDRVKSVKFSPDDTILASCGEDLVIKLWDLQTSQCKVTLSGHNGWIQSLDFNNPGTLLVSAGDDGIVNLWDLTNNSCINSFVEKSPVSTVIFTPDGDSVIYGLANGVVKKQSLDNGSFKTQHLDTKITSLAISNNRNEVAIGLVNGSIWLWDYHENNIEKKQQGHFKAVRNLRYNDKEELYSCSDDETIKIWSNEIASDTKTIVLERPYEGMNIVGVKGLTESQKITLQHLGAITEKK